jgi:hypothetical protein
MYTILDSLVLRNGLEKQPGPARRLDDDLSVAGNEIRVYGVTDHLAPELRQGVRISAVERNVSDERHHDRTA